MSGYIDEEYIYTCTECGKDIHESFPMYRTETEVYCTDCSFKKGLITDQQYLKWNGVSVGKAKVVDGEIVVVLGYGKFPTDKTPSDYRHSTEYKKWRSTVFRRDNYTCAICGKKGGNLEAHHIKTFAKHKDVRFDPDNGVTLCRGCHRRVHKEKIDEWLHS